MKGARGRTAEALARGCRDITGAASRAGRKLDSALEFQQEQTDAVGKGLLDRALQHSVEKVLRAFGAAVAKAGGVVGATGHGMHALPPKLAAVSADADAADEGWRERCFSGNLDSAAQTTAAAMVTTLERLYPKEETGPPNEAGGGA